MAVTEEVTQEKGGFQWGSPILGEGELDIQWFPLRAQSVSTSPNSTANCYPPFWSTQQNRSHIFIRVVIAALSLGMKWLAGFRPHWTWTEKGLPLASLGLGRYIPRPDPYAASQPILSILDPWLRLNLSTAGDLWGDSKLIQQKLNPQRIDLLNDNSGFAKLTHFIITPEISSMNMFFLKRNVGIIQFIKSSET